MKPNRPIAMLPLAAMMLAALASYAGLPRMLALQHLALDGFAAISVLDLSQVHRLSQRLASLAPESVEAQELRDLLDDGAKALNSACNKGQFVAAPAPALSKSLLGFMPQRMTLDSPEFCGALAALLPSGMSSLNRPPPCMGWSEQPFHLPVFTPGAIAPVRAPPFSLR